LNISSPVILDWTSQRSLWLAVLSSCFISQHTESEKLAVPGHIREQPRQSTIISLLVNRPEDAEHLPQPFPHIARFGYSEVD